MLRLARWPAVMLLATTLSACATMSVSSHVERGLDFTQYHTWDWGTRDALPPTDPRLDSPSFQDHLQGAVERQLARRQLARTEPGGKPDLLVHYHANVSERISANQSNQSSGACYDANCAVRVLEQEVGTILIDVMDARTNRLIWRGWVQTDVEGVLNNERRLDDRLEKAVQEMFAQFPR
ncbi:MAG: DUF4136 domain-containing protein [Vicinamibacterales bacterium]